MSKQNSERRRITASALVYTALCAVLIAVCSWIAVPFAVPFTMQTFAVFFCLYFLGGLKGSVSVLVYLLLGLAGLPVFAGFKAGAGALVGPTGGYLLGFILTALVYWLATSVLGQRRIVKITALAVGLVCCYVAGTLWFCKVYADGGSAMSFSSALMACVVPFILPDAAKLALAVFLAEKMQKIMKKRV